MPHTSAPAAPFIVGIGGTTRAGPVRMWDGDGPIWCAEGLRIRGRTDLSGKFALGFFDGSREPSQD